MCEEVVPSAHVQNHVVPLFSHLRDLFTHRLDGLAVRRLIRHEPNVMRRWRIRVRV